MRNDWICVDYVTTRSDDIIDALAEHVWITVASVVSGFVAAFALALLVRQRPWLRQVVIGASTLVYTIPSLVLFGLLLSTTGLTTTTVIVGLTLYSLTILVRGILAGLDGVSADVREAAIGMGYDGFRLLSRVEMPLALPAIFAALRVTTVSTVAMTTVGMVVGHGGLGDLIFRGLRSNFRAEVLTASALCVILALAADLLLVGILRLSTPWRRAVS